MTLLAPIVLAMAGCGPSTQVNLQRQEIAYQTKIALIINRLARSPAEIRHVVPELRHAIGRLERVNSPAPVRELHQQLLAGLRKELGALGKAASIGANTSTIHSAVRADARARSEVSHTLKRMTRLIGACRADAARC